MSLVNMWLSLKWLLFSVSWYISQNFSMLLYYNMNRPGLLCMIKVYQSASWDRNGLYWLCTCTEVAFLSHFYVHPNMHHCHDNTFKCLPLLVFFYFLHCKPPLYTCVHTYLYIYTDIYTHTLHISNSIKPDTVHWISTWPWGLEYCANTLKGYK